jgi:hypothetical protein
MFVITRKLLLTAVAGAAVLTLGLSAVSAMDAHHDHGAATKPQEKPQITPEMIASYPLDTCVVSGEKLDSMGKPNDLLYQHRLVRLCCTSCTKTFNANPDKYLKLIDEAAAKKAASTQPAPETPKTPHSGHMH